MFKDILLFSYFHDLARMSNRPNLYQRGQNKDLVNIKVLISLMNMTTELNYWHNDHLCNLPLLLSYIEFFLH